jgi:hypothetical protein
MEMSERYISAVCSDMAIPSTPNDQAHLLPEAGATQERRL